MSIYTEISANRRRTWLLMVLFIILVAAVVQGAAWLLGGGYEAGIIALAASALFAIFSYYASSSVVLNISHATEVKHDDNPDLYHIVENLCIGAGLPVPKIYIINDSAPNAFAAGRDPKHAVVVVTKGLLQKLDRLELEGVIAHELSHIRNYDIRVMTITVVLIGLVALIADITLRMTWFGAGRRRGGDRGAAAVIMLIIALVGLILAPIAARLIHLAISRRREYLADASGALLTRYPEGLARALEKISNDREPLEVANKATAHLYIVNPLKDRSSFMNNLFSTHPPIQERIRRLRAM